LKIQASGAEASSWRDPFHLKCDLNGKSYR
jgi:hypothetical protein